MREPALPVPGLDNRPPRTAHGLGGRSALKMAHLCVPEKVALAVGWVPLQGLPGLHQSMVAECREHTSQQAKAACL